MPGSSRAVSSFLEKHKLIGLDTSIFIFQLEANPAYAHLTHEVFVWLKSKGGKGVTSTLAMLELLVHPYRASDLDRVNRSYALLSTYPNLAWMELTLAIADHGAQLRADYGLRTPDAILAATALDAGATGFVSNDTAFRKVKGFELLLLQDSKEL